MDAILNVGMVKIATLIIIIVIIIIIIIIIEQSQQRKRQVKIASTQEMLLECVGALR